MDVTCTHQPNDPDLNILSYYDNYIEGMNKLMEQMMLQN